MTPLCDTYTGPIADWYDDWLSGRKEDIAYYLEAFLGHSRSALELACGTGRLLLPIVLSEIPRARMARVVSYWSDSRLIYPRR